jgi:carboxymethylenebutenolidase
LPLIEPNYARARQVEDTDPRLTTGYVKYPGLTGEVRAYRARPKGTGKLPAVLVIHENRGLNAHIEDVARRVAVAGYLALAPDGLTSAGGAPADQEQARDLFGKTDPAKIAGDILAAVPWLSAHAESNGKSGVVGFCYGGGMALRCAVEQPGVAAAVCFYGRTLSAEEVAKLKTPVLLHYAGKDERINTGIADFRAALDANGVAYSLNMYPGTQHGFHNDSSQARYDAAAAKLAWDRTLDFFGTYLK